MQVYMKPGTRPLTRERELTEKLMSLSRRLDDAPYAVIGIEHRDGNPRILVTCHTQTEYIGAIQVLEEKKLQNRALTQKQDEDGNLVYEVDKTNFPAGMHELFRDLSSPDRRNGQREAK
jgi:hypothetical protein